MFDLLFGIFVIAFCALSLLATHKNWTWWTDNPYSNPMRNEWGEDGLNLYNGLICWLGIFAGVFMILGINPFEKGDDTTAAVHGAQLEISDSHGQYIYQLDGRRQNLLVTETSFISKIRRGTHGGLTAELRYFDEVATQKFEKKFKNSDVCPASFFNRYSQLKTLYASEPAVKAELKSWENKTWKNTDEWFQLNLVGRCIKGASSYVVKETEMADRIRKGTFSNCSHFHVDRIESRTPFLVSQSDLGDPSKL